MYGKHDDVEDAKRQLAALYASKGDLPGHAFRGNQWTVGEEMAGRPSKPRERVRTRMTDIPSQAYEHPPEPKVLGFTVNTRGAVSDGGAVRGGVTSSGHLNTEIGDAAEDALVGAGLGFRKIQPLGDRRNPLDVEWHRSGYAFELKAVTREASEYKAKPKAIEVKSKVWYAKAHKLKPGTIIAVVDTGATRGRPAPEKAHKGKVRFYLSWGIGANRVTPKMTYLGEHKIKIPKRVFDPTKHRKGKK